MIGKAGIIVIRRVRHAPWPSNSIATCRFALRSALALIARFIRCSFRVFLTWLRFLARSAGKIDLVFNALPTETLLIFTKFKWTTLRSARTTCMSFFLILEMLAPSLHARAASLNMNVEWHCCSSCTWLMVDSRVWCSALAQKERATNRHLHFTLSLLSYPFWEWVAICRHCVSTTCSCNALRCK